MSRVIVRALLFALLASDVFGVEPVGTVRLRVEAEGAPVAGAEVRWRETVTLTDAQGGGVLHLPVGHHTFSVRRLGYGAAMVPIDVTLGMDTTLVVSLVPEVIDVEEVVVHSTRSGRRIEEEPVRVEVLGREEIEEKMLMTPGDIGMMLNETSGLRVQSTSPSLGGANVRVQGLRGRYTQILSDGLPLYGGQTGSLSMLQIPPMDLRQTEVIKGVASALYGPSALGGVVNLISRAPVGERELLLNRTTRGGTDAVLWMSGTRGEAWGYTLLGGGHTQDKHDANGDGWADLPEYRRAVVRPRLFWKDGRGRSLFLTVGATAEDREGGTRSGAVTPAGVPYVEALDSRRLDVGVMGRTLVGGSRLLGVRASVMGQRHDHRFGGTLEQDLHASAFGEATFTGSDAGHTWLLGAALEREAFRSDDLSRFDYTHVTPSLFAQDEFAWKERVTVAASARVDSHSEYGAVVTPRLSVLIRPDAGWTVRASAGTGYFAPTPFTEETEVLGLSPLEPLSGLGFERARSASMDVGRTSGPFELNATLFGSEVQNPVLLRSIGGGRVELVHAPGPTRTHGTDLLARYHREPIHVTATYTYTRSTELEPETGVRREVPLTPRHAAGLVGMWEKEEVHRLGVELYYTGRQQLEDDPFRSASRPYVILGFLVERRLGDARVFLNAENLLDARQTRHDPLLLPAPTPEGRWTTDVWAPLEGRTFNAGVRLGW